MAREMKDSGIEWIGEIPKEWNVAKVKYHLHRNEPRNPGNCIVLSLYRELGIVPKDSRDDNHNVTSLDISNYKYVRIGDFVINKMKAWQGSVAVSDYEGVVSPAYYVYNFIDDSFDKRFIHYLLRSCYKDEFRRLSGGIREGQWDLSSDSFDNTLLIIPPLPEQEKIAKFLDSECARIDEVISKTKSTIEEYKKLKQSVITEAVTKGIRANREMKDSGIEWIGEIPKEWEITCIKRFCKLQTGSTPSTANSEWFDGSLDWFTPCDFNEQYLLSNSQRKLSENAKADNVATIIPENTVLLIGIGGTAGKIGMTTYECSCNQQITALITKELVGKFLMYWLIANTKFLKETALYTTLPILNNETIGEYLLLVPFGSEQQEIADYLDKKCAEINTLITKKEQIVSELESYKKSLIYEYVTGKKEVV